MRATHERNESSADDISYIRDLVRVSNVDFAGEAIEFHTGKTVFDIVEVLQKCRKAGLAGTARGEVFIARSLANILRPVGSRRTIASNVARKARQEAAEEMQRALRKARSS